jgi:hypothetical protein
MLGASARLEKYSRHLADGLLTVTEVAAVVLDELADSPDWAVLWAAAPELLRNEILAFLARVGPAGVLRAWYIGDNNPEWLAAQTARRQAVAEKLLADFP